ncbi:MAG: CHASE domain-containing protein [Novosphingobium sp.]
MDKALLARVQQQAWFHRYPRGIPIALLVITLLATILFVANFERLDKERREARMDRDATALADALQHKAAENIAYLNAAASLFSIADTVSEAEFSAFIADMSSDLRVRGGLGMGWGPWITAGDVPAFEAMQQAFHQSKAFHIRPIPDNAAARMVVISLLQPATPENQYALGFDMYSEPRRKVALDNAIRTGRPAVTTKLHLIQDAEDKSITGFLIYVPVFERRSEGAINQRGPLKGFVYASLRAREFLDAAIARVPHEDLDIELYDGEIEPENLLAATPDAMMTEQSVTRDVQIGDRTWTLVVTSGTGFGLAEVSRLTLLFGILLSFLLSALAWYATSRAADDRKVLEWLSRQSSIRTLLTRELNHRVKNTLANVLSIIALTRRRSNSIDEFANGLSGRIRALSATHDLLSESDWRDVPLRDVVVSELAPYLDPDDSHVDLDGPVVPLAANDALSLGLALHELSTNAAKYGALSVPEGRVEVSWKMAGPDLCEVEWKERGGPPVSQPTRRGFGADLIEKVVSHELNSPVNIAFEPDGVRCNFKVPVRDRPTFSIREGSMS